MKKIIIIIILLFMFNIDALASCDYSTIARLRKLVNNINISYDYRIENNTAYFSVTINNITPEMYFIDYKTGNKYTYYDTNNGEITINGYTYNGSKYRFYSAISECYSKSIGEKYYNFPTYNWHYANDYCKEMPNFSYCQKWANVNLTTDEVRAKIKEYKENLEIKDPIVEKEKTIIDILIDLYIKYYWILLPAIIISCLTVIMIKRKKDSFSVKF